MKFKEFYLLAAVALLSGCQNNESAESVDEQPAVTIVANIGETPSVTSRYVHDSSTDNASFSKDDAIGIFMDENDAVKWTYNGSAWDAENTMYWVDRTDAKHWFYAFYPYVSAESKEYVSMPSLEGQDGSTANLGKHDFLIATTEKAYSENNGQVEFTFKHVSSLLKLTLVNTGDLQGATIHRITIEKTGLLTPQTYSFIDKTTTSLENAAIDALTWESENGHVMDGNLSLYFIVNGTSANKASGVASLVIEYTNGGKNYTAERSDFPLAPISGSKHIFNIKINSDQLVIITGSTITEWQGDEAGEDIVINGKEDTTTEN